MIKNTNKKAISPVVATALLLVVAVVAVVGFQNWFGTYSSGVFSNVEVKSDSGSNGLKIENLVGDTLYISNNLQDNLNITTLKIGGQICNLTNNLTLGMNEIPVSSCVGNLTTSTPDIVLVTEKNVVSKQVYVKDANIVITADTSTSLSQSDCDAIPWGDWILVPGNALYGTSDFCVMKYEAKQNGSNATSTAANPPWVSINQTDAREACSNLGSGYHLITNAEWMTIARNIEQVDNNWVNSIGGITSVGVGSLKQGNVGASGIIGASYDGANPENSSDGVNSLGSLELDNGEVIWDLSGNVWEWNNDRLNMHTWAGGGSTGYWDSQSNATFRLNAGPSNSLWGSSTGTGYVWHSSTQTHAFLRGGYWAGTDAGAFALRLNYDPSSSDIYFGFRCTYTP